MTSPWQVGDISIQRVVEVEMPLLPLRMLLPTLTDDILTENRDWMEQCGALAPDEMARMCIQSYIVRTPHHTVLIDTCFGNDKNQPDFPPSHQRKDDKYLRGLAAAGFAVEDIDIVLCTHLHIDHVGWNTRLENGRWVPTFPKARYLFSARELEYWQAKPADFAQPHLTESVLPIVAAGRADLVSSAHELSDHVRLLPTPGHTPDHFGVRLGHGRDLAVMTGDLLHTPLQARYPELSMFVDYDPAQAAATRRNFLERYCETDTLCCTAHFPSPSAGRITRRGGGFSCDMVAE